MITWLCGLASKRRVETLLRIVFGAILVLAIPAAEAGEPTVVTSSGTFTAVPSPNAPGADVFLGIRYAAPPVGALRWQPPQAATPTTGTVVAGTPGPACPQPSFLSPQSEDCLILNVYVPSSAKPNSALPVLFWIHGGGGTQGAAIQFDPSVMVAENDIIVVTINYRLGLLGLIVDSALAATAPNAFQNIGDVGDYTLMDQQFAMQWVQKNIKGFGGDPRKVTIGGQSAGAGEVWDHLVSTQTAAGLFRGAIVESGANGYGGLVSQAVAESNLANSFELAVGCPPPTDADCLRSQPVAAVLNAQNVVPPLLVTGTKILPSQPLTGFQSGQFIQVPVLQGTTANEYTVLEPPLVPFPGSFQQAFAAGGPANLDLTVANSLCSTPPFTGTPAVCTYAQELNVLLAELAIPPPIDMAALRAQVAADYPLANFPDPYLPGNAPSADEALSQILTDLQFSCLGLQSNQDLAKFVPVFSYEFDDPLAPPPQGIAALIAPNDANGFPTAAAHAAELHFLFTLQFDEPQIAPLDPNEQQLAHEMQTYWANFVKTGNPNFGSESELNPPWLPFNYFGFVQELVPPPKTSHPSLDFSKKHFCATWLPVMKAFGR